jgi:glycosyltransferase involved in cell wall biosynthesis
MKNVDWSKWNTKNDNFQKYSHIKSHLIYGVPVKKTELVSIMIITHKRAHGLKDALDSALAQDYKDYYSITVLDDSSFDQETDNLMKEYCEKYKNIIYYRNERNLGQYANWNRACELSVTEWFCLLHDDDTLGNNYLTETVKVIKDEKNKNIGLLGVCFTTIDNRDNANNNPLQAKIIHILTSLFIKLRNKQLIQIKLEDNIKLIYVLSCCLMINKNKVIEIGGLDDSYFPSADFVLSSKMNYYYSTVFLPEFLCYRGIGENESLKQKVCKDSIKCAYYHTLAMLETTMPQLSQSKKQNKASFAAVAAEIGVLGYNKIDYSHTKNELGMKLKYNSKFVRMIIMLKSRFTWGTLLFRNNEVGKK